MAFYYRLQIDAEGTTTHNKISQVLKIDSISKDYWIYERIVNEENDDYDFINDFLGMLDGKYDALEALGINRDDISFWQLYEYDQQCNMEFDPLRMKRLGEMGITLCISCWQKPGN